MKAYKVFNSDWTCRNFQFEIGKSYHQEGDIVPCVNGFHCCEKLVDCFNYYSFNPSNKVAEVEISGTILKHGDKYCSSDIKIVKELSWNEVLEKCNLGYGNSGYHNSGHRNSGYHNSGDYNSGYRNSGDCNSGDYNSGHFNTIDQTKIFVFNKLIEKRVWDSLEKPDFIYFNIVEFIKKCDMSDQEKEDNPNYETTNGYLKTLDYKEAFKKSWDKAKLKDDFEYQLKLLKQLPNFDKDIFKEISGIDIDKD